MGLEDRDWYREETARKSGMRYNSKNATYSAAQHVLNSAQRSLDQGGRFTAVERMRSSNRKRWQLVFLVLCAIVSLAFAALLFLRVLRF